jgi:hypothetical protein
MKIENPGVAPPPDATKLDVWEQHSDGEVKRFFHGTQRGERVQVDIVGWQNGDGSVADRTIFLESDGDDLSVAEVQELIDDLAAARDEINRLSER